MKPVNMISQIKCLLCENDKRKVLFSGHDMMFDNPQMFDVVRCAECGFMFTDPIPGPEEMQKYYPSTYYKPHPVSRRRLSSPFKKMSANYSRILYSHLTQPCFRGSALIALLGTVHRLSEFSMPYKTEPGNLLDIGCGTGRFLAPERELGWTCSGIDLSSDAVKQAQGVGLNVNCGTLRDQNYPPETFDLININHVLEHLPNPLDELREVRRILSKKGFLRIGSPLCARPLASWFGKYGAWFDLPRHLNHFEVNSLHKLLDKAGMEIRACSFTTSTSSIAVSLRSLAKHKWMARYAPWKSQQLVRFFSPNNRILRMMLFPAGVLLKMLKISPEVIIYARKRNG